MQRANIEDSRESTMRVVQPNLVFVMLAVNSVVRTGCLGERDEPHDTEHHTNQGENQQRSRQIVG